MRKKSAWIAIIIIVLALIVLVGPFLSGIYFEKKYQQLLSQFKNKNEVDIQLLYQRGWFYSNAVLSIHLVGLENENIPANYIFEQNIQHGPLLYSAQKLSSLIGLAAIQNQLRFTPEIKQFVIKYELNKDILEINHDYISFFGNYYKYIKLGKIKTFYPNTKIQVVLNGLEGGIWFFPGSERMNGSFNFKEVSISDDQVKILIPQVQLDFDQYQDIKNIWLGKNTLIIHQLIWNEENKTILKMEDINFNGYLEKKSGQLDGMRVLQIGQIYVDNNLIGPIYMQLSVNKLNLDAIVSMIQAYQEITQRGELYQSQLSQKLKMMVPNIINEGSQLKLDSLNIKTPEGVLQVSGEMAWNIEKAALPENISELMQSANAELHFRISKPLIEKWIQFVSTSTFFNQINPELQKADRKIRKDISIAMRQNANAILQMTREGAISEKDTLFLLLLQKKMVSLEEYNAATRQLLLEKSITLETSHMLIYWYSQVENSITILSNMAKESKKTIQSLMHAQITHMIDEGYIKLENNEYVMSLSQDEKGVKVNEKLVSSPDN